MLCKKYMFALMGMMIFQTSRLETTPLHKAARLGNLDKVITPSQSKGLDGCEQPQGLPIILLFFKIRPNYPKLLDV